MPDPLARRFWEKVTIPDDPDGCWGWTGTTNRPGGYGQICGVVNGRSKMMGAHRVSWSLHYGPIPDGYYVCHHCDTPTCTRPDHLFLGTPADNMHDRDRKGRGRFGPNAPNGPHPRSETCAEGHPRVAGAHHCKPCFKAYQQRYYHEHQEYLNAYRRMRRKIVADAKRMAL